MGGTKREEGRGEEVEEGRQEGRSHAGLLAETLTGSRDVEIRPCWRSLGQGTFRVPRMHRSRHFEP